MSVLRSEIELHGSAVMPDDDATNNIGGAISTSKKVSFSDMSAAGNVQAVSSAAGDTTQTVTAYGKNAAGEDINEVKTLNGTTVVPMTVNTTWERLLKAIKSATTTGDVALEAVTAERSNTAQGGAAKTASVDAYITLDAGASAVDDYYKGMVLRLTGGTGSGQIREVLYYDGTTKRAYVKDWGTLPDGTTTFKISNGMVFDKSPAEITEVRKLFYNAAAPPAGTRKYYEKVFFKNNHGTLSLTNAVIKEAADPSAKIAFALETSLNGTDTNGAGNNRQVAPGGYTFDSGDENVANSQNHTAGSGQGVWIELSLAAGDAATKTSYTPSEEGNSV